MTKYDEIMDRVVVTDGMRDRILRNIRQQQRHTHPMRSATTWLPILAAAAVLIVVCGVAYGNLGDRNLTTDSDSSSAVAAIWQAEEYDSAGAMSAAVGFEITDLTNLPLTPSETTYIVITGDLAEILYDDADGNEVCYRKSSGTEDNSGDYNTYTVIVDAAIGDYPLTLSGDEQAFHLATWTDGSYAYSINVSNGCSEEALLAMVQEAMQ